VKARSFFGTLIVALWIIAASFMVVLSAPVTTILAEKTVTTTNSLHSHDYLVSIAEATRSFSLGNDDAPLPLGPNERIAFTPDVIDHLLDVRAVFQGAITVFFILSFLFVVFLLLSLSRGRGEETLVYTSSVTDPGVQWGKRDNALFYTGASPGDIGNTSNARRMRRRSLGNSFVAGGWIVLILCVFLLVLGWAAFDVFFSYLHALFFAGGTWQFAYDSLLILALPEEFWMGCATVWAGALVVLSLLSIIIGGVIKGRNKVSEPATAGVPRNAKQAKVQSTPHRATQGASHGASHGASQRVSRNAPHSASSSTSRNAPHRPPRN